ncbi:MAG: aldehyde dehydrogenase family protein [Flavobacteriales bacterium]|nr:aldehyde dehydrogenase family protein [Flavobacteriales bacterium]
MSKTTLNANIFREKRQFFDQGKTLNFEFREEQLSKLEKAILSCESEIISALQADLKKSEMEGYLTEIHVALDDIRFIRKNLREWMSPQVRETPFALQPSTSTLRYEPKGVALIISPWNYPFMLLINPLAGAIASGCCVIVKPSEDSPATSQLLEKIISETFDQNYISVVQGPGQEIVPALIENHEFNHIFFTGSPNVGKLIAKMAAETLTSTTLELGGKSPAVIDGTGKFKTLIRRLLWGKFMNNGQSCVSPDYILLKKGLEEKFIATAKDVISQFYGENPKDSDSLPRLINLKRFDAVVKFLECGKVVIGGDHDRDSLYIAPTVMTDIDEDSVIMKEEIFGPILPILTYESEEDILRTVRKNRYPLSCYYFGKNRELRDFILDRIEFGGGSVNNTMVQFGIPDLPVGGIQGSGSGHYHGFYSFECFSNAKTIVETATWIDPALKYPPYNKTKLGWIKKLLG